jgi:hypothetical protein
MLFSALVIAIGLGHQVPLQPAPSPAPVPPRTSTPAVSLGDRVRRVLDVVRSELEKFAASLGLIKQGPSPVAQFRLTLTPDGAWEAAYRESITVTSPAFDTVELRRHAGTGFVSCGQFAGPALRENGVDRTWIYSLAASRSGLCASGEFSAVARRGTTELETPRVSR